MSSLRLVACCFPLAVLAGCGSGRLALPEGRGTPYSDYAPLFDTAVSECRRVRTLEALITLGGRGGGASLRGRVRVGLAAPGSVRLEGLAPFGAPTFYLVAAPGEATLWLTREGQVVTDASAADLLAS